MTIPSPSPYLLEGRTPSTLLKNYVTKKVQQWTGERKHPPPRLDVIVVGDDGPSRLYVQRKKDACEKVGILSYIHAFPSDISEDAVISKIDELSSSASTHGILLQLPTGPSLDGYKLMHHVCPHKDVDGLTPWNQGLLALGGQPSLFPCTPLGCMALLQSKKPDLAGVRACVVGYSPLVGASLVPMLAAQGCSVSIVHKDSHEPWHITQSCEVLIVATGCRGLIQRKWVHEGSWVIDVGIHHCGAQISGDVDYDGVKDHVRAITPVPGGVGPMTIAMLLANTLRAYEYLEHQISLPSLKETIAQSLTII